MITIFLNSYGNYDNVLCEICQILSLTTSRKKYRQKLHIHALDSVR
nr:MAG TPA: hypothetical protein [Caudoviricetes sp.]